MASSRPGTTCSSSSCRSSSALRALRRIGLLVLLALAFPAAASAHARLVGSKPADGSVVANAPADVRLLFDDEVRPTGGARAVDAKGASVLGGREARLGSDPRAIVVPLRRHLPRGSYTVRWEVVSNDGHTITGVIAFAVGAGSPRPVATLSAGGGPSASSVLLRLLFLAGVLLAGGGALAGRILLDTGHRLVESAIVGVGLAFSAAGGFGLLALEPAADATRFGRVTETAAVVALAGCVAAVAAYRFRFPAYAATAAGLAELAAPTLAGHALDPRRLRGLIALADFVHVAAAAFWIGGIVVLAVSSSALARRRFPPLALLAVGLLGLAAIPRAIAALSSAGDLVHTGYGRALLVKTGLLASLVAVAAVNRRRLRRVGFGAELVLLAGVVAAVAVLTDLRPPAPAPAVAAPAPARPPDPPPDALVLAGEDDDLAVGLAASPRGGQIALQVTALGQDGRGVSGLQVGVAGVSTTPCGSGCYSAVVSSPPPPRRIDVTVSGGGRRPAVLRFTLPDRWPAPAAAALVARTSRVYRALRSLVIHERLASSSRNVVVTTYRIAAPDRLAYRIVNGPQAVIVGATRWDRQPGGRWQRSATQRIVEPQPFWGDDPVRNAHLLGTGRVAGREVRIASFFDPRIPAWFQLWIDRRSFRLLALRMTAQAHFMRHRYTGFDVPQRIRPPR